VNTLKVKLEYYCVIPRVPNFITLAQGGKLPLDALTKKSLHDIADEWRENLLARADQMVIDRDKD